MNTRKLILVIALAATAAIGYITFSKRNIAQSDISTTTLSASVVLPPRPHTKPPHVQPEENKANPVNHPITRQFLKAVTGATNPVSIADQTIEGLSPATIAALLANEIGYTESDLAGIPDDELGDLVRHALEA